MPRLCAKKKKQQVAAATSTRVLRSSARLSQQSSEDETKRVKSKRSPSPQASKPAPAKPKSSSQQKDSEALSFAIVKSPVTSSGHPMADKFVAELSKEFAKNGSTKISEGMRKYMRNLFPFHGIMTTPRISIQEPLLNKYIFSSELPGPEKAKLIESIVATLWNLEEREYQYCALNILSKAVEKDEKSIKKKSGDPLLCPSLDFVQGLIRHKPWWDTVDGLASKVVGAIVLKDRDHYKNIMDEWIKDDHLWVRRTAILHQLKYKEKTDTKVLFEYCKATFHEEDFFIRKAIGWSLREYAKTDKKAVKIFITEHKDKMSTLSYREAAKHM